MASHYDYLIVGAGIAGTAAADGIRELDAEGSILLVGQENHLPYDRPPLSKKLWTGAKKLEDIYLHDREYYADRGITLRLGTRVVRLHPTARVAEAAAGAEVSYGKALIATSGMPRRLDIPAGEPGKPGKSGNVVYFRGLDDYLSLRASATPGASAVVIGGSFIGSELAAALAMNRVAVTMVFSGPWLASRVFPEGLARALESTFRERGIAIRASERPVEVARLRGRFLTRTDAGAELPSDVVVAGPGLVLDLDLPRAARLDVADGVVVNEYLETSRPDVYAAGDIALFPYVALGRRMRVEHWDNAVSQGRQAGRNMAGAREPYVHMPYFFSDLFEFGYEAVGEVDTTLDVRADWQKPYQEGVVYYIRDDRVRGVMMCNVWDRVDTAREIIRRAEPVTSEALRGLIR
jgi:3-phenylpropionate/trans-cinnamate dioxygenase ferredoxin reductase subunit